MSHTMPASSLRSACKTRPVPPVRSSVLCAHRGSYTKDSATISSPFDSGSIFYSTPDRAWVTKAPRTNSEHFQRTLARR